MISNWKIELIISIQILLIELLFGFTSFFIIYYFFNFYLYPPTFGISFWLIIIIIIGILNYFIAKLILKKKKLSKKRKEVILFSSIFLSVISLFMFSTFLESISYSSIKINSINELRNSKEFEYVVKNIEIINEPKLFSRIKRETKPVRIYTEVFYTFPFNPKTENIYYCLLFKEQIEANLSNKEEQRKLNSLIQSTNESIKNHNFQSNHKFKVLTKMYREREGFENTIQNNSDNVIFLMPIKKSLKNDFYATKEFFVKFMIGIFLVYIFIYLLTKVEECK